ncbi:MAG: hypothetical protein K2Y23_16840 [Cyanobacteria bacterium]|nr:hypothetical protein [Cyanobacteriota bacterium]
MAPAQRPVHLSDSEIDAYSTGRLPAADEERLEVHFLECDECRERVAAVEVLVDALRLEPPAASQSRVPVGLWKTAAAIFAIVAAGATWQWIRLARESGVVTPPSAWSVQTDAGVSTMRVGIEPPTRSGAAIPLTVPTNVAIVMFDLDAREAGAPGESFDVSLTGPGGRRLLRLEARSSPAGRIEIPVHRSLLGSGQFVFELGRERTVVALPVLINEPIPQ